MPMAGRTMAVLLAVGCLAACGEDERLPMSGAERNGNTLTIYLGCVNVSDAEVRVTGNAVRVSIHGEQRGGDCQTFREIELAEDSQDLTVVIDGDRCWAGEQGVLTPAACVDD